MPSDLPRRWMAVLRLAACLGVLAGCTLQEPTIAGTEHICSSCHGPDGKSVSPTFPNLAGQQPEYMETQLKAFRDHSRADPHAHTYMWGMAAHLSDAQISDLAKYYAALPPAAGTAGDGTEVAGGRQIYEAGVPAQNVPACVQCHGGRAEGNQGFPRLAGQHRSYLERQLEAFASQARANEIMHENSKNLTAPQISAVAAYLAAQ